MLLIQNVAWTGLPCLFDFL
uniref:Uncharacterized protein n=1 Tax=Arundo donax TaxID=35708 RepID=A0A0A9A9Q4_ARUDO